MKVFEVIVDYYPDDSEEIVREKQYVTSEEGTIKSVVDHFARHCREYEKTLVGVREVLNITQRITKAEEKY